jgi:Dyp-type peroxidase family
MAEALDLPDIQGFIARGYAGLKGACYVLLAIDRPASARRWLKALAASITPGDARPQELALNIAFTSSGLQKLGLPQDALAMFSYEFRTGMTTQHRRRILGDIDESAPETWGWGGPNTATVDLALLMFARDDAKLDLLYRSYATGFADAGLAEIRKLTTSDIGDVEHFGFRDGVSQPIVEGLSKTGPPAHTIKAGEFILGYLNEYGHYTDRPLLAPGADPGGLLPKDPAGSGSADLGRSGSYLVMRQLGQDVPAFWRWVDGETRNPDGSANPAARLMLASKMVGRWPSGAPLVLSPERDDPALANPNDFMYAQSDAHGYACPIGAHIRRANPRDSLDPRPGSTDSIAVNKRHRLLRRGRTYGPPLSMEQALSDPDTPGAERGLHFICLNGNIARQFEFVQHTWINNPKFDELYDDADPILAGRENTLFTVQARPVRARYCPLPRFVRVGGGAYFFLPGIRALRYLASQNDSFGAGQEAGDDG